MFQNWLKLPVHIFQYNHIVGGGDAVPGRDLLGTPLDLQNSSDDELEAVVTCALLKVVHLQSSARLCRRRYTVPEVLS